MGLNRLYLINIHVYGEKIKYFAASNNYQKKKFETLFTMCKENN